MEIFRALAVLAEPPAGPEIARIAGLLDLGESPSASEYTETFVFQLYPYASVYLGAEGMLGGEARDRVAGFLSALGLTPPHEPDHLSTLLAAYAQLSAPEEDDNDADEVDTRARRRESLRAARKAFLWEHLLSWLPVYLDRVAEVAPPFYRRWAELLLSALIEEARACGPADVLPLHLREAPPVSDPRVATADEFSQSLIAPARSGFILTRADLARAARALGTGVRAGERKFVLKTLLGQDSSGVLAWLAEEASRWAARHGRRREALGEVARWWAARAEATEKLLRELKACAAEAS